MKRKKRGLSKRSRLLKRACALRPAYASTKPIFKKSDAELEKYIRENK